MKFNASAETADFVANFIYDSNVKDCTTIYHNQEYYYNKNFTLKVIDADSNTILTPNDDITKGDYKNVLSLNDTQSCITFNSKYDNTPKNFRIELLANVDVKPDPKPTPGGDDNTSTIIWCCVVAIIVIIAVAVVCIKRNSAKRMPIDGDRN